MRDVSEPNPGMALPAMPEVALPRKRRGRSRPAAVILAPNPLRRDGGVDHGGHAPEWLREGLVSEGIAVVSSPAVTGDASNAGRAAAIEFDPLVDRLGAALAAIRSDDRIDPARVVVAGLGLGAQVAMALAATTPALPVVLISPLAVELVVRRLDRAAERAGATVAVGPPTDHERLIRSAARRQPMRALAMATARPVLIIHPAADATEPEHAHAIAGALRLDGRIVERLAVAFAAPAFEGDQTRATCCAAIARFAETHVAPLASDAAPAFRPDSRVAPDSGAGPGPGSGSGSAGSPATPASTGPTDPAVRT